MIDWAPEVESRNYGIRKDVDTGYFSEILRIVLSVAVVASALFFCSWVRSQIIGVGYEAQKLISLEEALLRDQKNLILEEATLKNPERIDSIARMELGMTPIRANQLIPPTLRGESGAGVLAMADPSGVSHETRKSSASN